MQLRGREDEAPRWIRCGHGCWYRCTFSCGTGVAAGAGTGRGEGELPPSRLDCCGARQGSLWGPSLTPLGSGQVKRAVVQVISAMAHHGYLEQPGGEAMVAYIVQQCALPPEAEVRAGPSPTLPGAPELAASREQAWPEGRRVGTCAGPQSACRAPVSRV